MSANIPTHDLAAAEFYRHDQSPVRKLIHMVLLLALKDRATEIHFEPQESGYRLSYCVEGTIYDMVPPPSSLAPAISQVFKVITELDICKQRTPQVGSLRLLAAGGEANAIVSIWPTAVGEAVRVEIESNWTSVEEIRRQLTEYRIGRGGNAAPISWLWRLWRLLSGFGRPQS